VGVKHVPPMISVLMSVFNGEQYLREAIDSILNQTFQDFEFIIIDDGSTDSSAGIINSYKDSRIHFIQQDNVGISESLNRGITLAKGKYIARMDADDISDPDRFRYQYEYMRANNDIDILGGHARLIDTEGRVIGEKLKPTSSKVINRAIEYACPLNHPTYMVRTDVYRELKGYRVCFSGGEDYDFLLRAFDQGNSIINIDRYLICYRINTSFSRPDRDYYQMFLTRIALQLHRQRVKYGREDSNVLASVGGGPKRVSVRFLLAYRWRNTLLLRAKNYKGIGYYAMMFAVVLVSLVDYELFCSSLRGWLYKRACVEN